jgi:hypothetical protein
MTLPPIERELGGVPAAVMRRARLQVLAVAVLSAALALGILSIFAASPAFSIGVWGDSEPMVVAVFLAGALCGLGLGAAALAGPNGIDAVAHPLVLLTAALGVLAFAAAALAEYPGAAALGAPQTGEGPLWYLAVAAMLAAARYLGSTRVAVPLVRLAMTVALAAAIANLARAPLIGRTLADIGFPVSLSLMRFNEYQAYFGVALLACAAWVAGTVPGRRLPMALVAAALVSIAVSGNRTAMAGVLIAAAAYYLLRTRPKFAAKVLRPLPVARTLIGVAVLPVVAVRIIDFHDIAHSLWSRGRMFAVLDPVLWDWRTLIAGHGFGHFGEYFARNLMATGTPIYGTDWGALDRDMFHSHNAALEALVAGGLPGLALRLLLPVAFVLKVASDRRREAFAIALLWVIVDAFWFLLPAVLAPLALGLGLLTATRAEKTLRWPGMRVPFALAGLAVATVLCGASLLLMREARAMSDLTRCLPPASPSGNCGFAPVPHELRGTDAGLATLLSSSVRPAVGASSGLPQSQRALLQQIVGAAERKVESGTSAVLGIALADSFAVMAFSDHGRDLLPGGEAFEARWARVVEASLRRAPGRIDVAVPYLEAMTAAGDRTALARILEAVENVAPEHPIGQWFSGLDMMVSSDPQQQAAGIARMRRALDDGVDLYMPVDDKVRRALDVR